MFCLHASYLSAQVTVDTCQDTLRCQARSFRAPRCSLSRREFKEGARHKSPPLSQLLAPRKRPGAAAVLARMQFLLDGGARKERV